MLYTAVFDFLKQDPRKYTECLLGGQMLLSSTAEYPRHGVGGYIGVPGTSEASWEIPLVLV